MGESIEQLVREELEKQGIPNVRELKDKDGSVRAIQINESLYTSPLITFCEKGLPAFRESGFQYDEHVFVEKVVRVAKEFLAAENEKNDSEYLRGRVELDGYILRFLNQVILEPSTHKTLQRQEISPAVYEEREIIDKKTSKETGTEVKVKKLVKVKNTEEGYVAVNSPKFTGTYRHEEMHVNTLDLICYLLAEGDSSGQVTPNVRDQKTNGNKNNKTKTNYQKTLPTYIDEGGKEQLITFKSRPNPTEGIEYAAKFSSSFWRNLYHNVKTCKFNGGDEFIAAMLDCADEHVHHLLLMPEAKREGRKEKKSSLLPAEIVAILIDAVDIETGKEYLVVEGVFGMPWTKRDYKERFCEETSEKGIVTIEDKLTEKELELREFYYGNVFDCIMEIALKTKRGVFINYCFSGHAQPPQGSIDFVNYVEQRNKRNPYYGLKVKKNNNGGVEGIRFAPIKEEYEKDDFSMRLRKKESPEVNKLFTAYRRFNTWYEWYKRQDELAKQQNRR